MSVAGAIDLHTHSTMSDGSDTPEQLMRAAHAAGVRTIAVTDHDTTDAWQRARKALLPGMTLIGGAEISCVWHSENPHEHSVQLHLLGYMFDPENPELQSMFAALRASRYTRGRAIVDSLIRDGVPIEWDDVVALAGAARSVGRPHIARVLVHNGVVSTVAEAFAPEWLGERYKREKRDVNVFTALRVLRQAGGVAVIAHPRARARGRVVPLRVLSQLAQMGLAGVEVDHTDHTAHDRSVLRAHAAEHGLLVTGSSDYHGSVKTVQLGENATTTPAVLDELVAQASGTAPMLQGCS